MPTVSWNRPLSSARRVAASLVTGFGIAAVVHLAILLVFFTVNGASSANIVPISDYFLPATLTLFVLASLAVVLGALRTWYFALLAGLVAGILAAFAGTAYGIVSKGTAWNADVFAAVLGTLVGTNLIYIIATVLVAVLLGPAIWAVAAWNWRGCARGRWNRRYRCHWACCACRRSGRKGHARWSAASPRCWKRQGGCPSRTCPSIWSAVPGARWRGSTCN